MQVEGTMSAVNDKFEYHNQGVLGNWNNGCLDLFPHHGRSEALYLCTLSTRCRHRMSQFSRM